MEDLGFVIGDQGYFSKAELFYYKIWEIRKHVFGEETPDTLEAMRNVAYQYEVQGKFTKAEAVFLKVWKSTAVFMVTSVPRQSKRR